ncbi:GIY-YIG catalytic domain [Desulfitobacterium hafniense]|uniref:GIY-YIG catalytic domain n=1 Tax=Desulfitobacterium hafniense TaxID=49338 RepID=A0A098AW48_DESHA|nr:sodium:proton symporter [Desulfitobacterium hafniense]CDX00844.1 GIY-YIG catalytic domain [Desulfitobacterium hafniense]
MQSITIKWCGPYNLERVHLSNQASENGIYIISRLWGTSETLLYIGRTKRQFQQRIKEHNYWLTQYRGQIKVRFGRIEGNTISEDLLADAESLLIILTETVENTSNLYSYSGRSLTINNIGRRGTLAKTISSDDLVEYYFKE